MPSIEELNDIELTDNVKKSINLNQSLKELINRHQGIFYKISSKYVNNNRFYDLSIDKELIYNSRDYIIYQSALSFDKSRNVKFVSYLGDQTKYFCLNEINKSKKRLETSQIKNLENHCFITSDNKNNQNKKALEEILNIVRNLDDPRIYEIFKCRFLQPKNNKLTPWNKVREKVTRKRDDKNLTIQGCINLYEKGIKQIQKEIIKDGEKFEMEKYGFFK